MEERHGDNLELKIRVIKGEIRENKRKKDKYWDAVLWIIFSFVALIIVGFYYFIVKKEKGIIEIILSVVLLLFFPILGYYWYNKYQKECQKIAKLEKELARLKEGLEKE